MKEPVSVWILLLINAIDLGSGLVCLNCPGVFHPHTCKHVTECFKDEICGMETFISNDGDKKYKLGCVDKNTCGRYAYTTSPPDAHGFQACHECCSATHLCNSAGCNNTGYPTPRGPICYNCENSPAGVPCHKIEFCESHEVCYNEATLEFQTDTLYSSGCRSRHNCAAPATSVIGKRDIDYRSVSVCSDCCVTDMCNVNCRKNDTCADHDTCQLLMQNYDVCGTQDVAGKFCRKSCNLCSTHPTCNDTNTDCYYQSFLVVNMCSTFQSASDSGCLRYCGYCSSTTSPQSSHIWITPTVPFMYNTTTYYGITTLDPVVAELLSNLSVGTRVIRGPDWSWGSQDGYGPGTITSIQSGRGWVTVNWDKSGSNDYRVGAQGKYDLQLYKGWLYVTGSSTSSPYFTSSTYSYQSTTIVHLVPGDRVIRGPDWQWGSQDHNGPGTVLSPSTPGWVRVRWDLGGTNSYRMGAEGATDLIRIGFANSTSTTSTASTTTVSTSIGRKVSIGDEVARGPDWKWGTQDKGGKGIVVSLDSTPGWVRVRWADGSENSYRNGAEGAYDLVKIDMSTTTTTTGFTTHFDLMSSTHSRTTAPAYGPALAAMIQVGSRVVRGRDWKWSNQDHGGPGVVTKVNSDGWVEVKWDTDGSSNTYRMGAENAYDLMLAP